MNREQNANNMRQEAAQKEPMRPRTRNLLTLLALAIAALTVWVIVSQNRAFSWHDFMKMLRGAKPGWLAAAAGCMFLYIFSEAAAVATACRPFGPASGWAGAWLMRRQISTSPPSPPLPPAASLPAHFL